MRTTTLNSYVYKEYSDDPNISSWVKAYNQATQYQIDWFNSVGLPYYPGLTDELLNWVALGLYGHKRTQLASPRTPAIGMPNTFMPSTFMPSQYVPSTQSFYNLSDDIFKRILTWNLYKGDGRTFSIRWLKRRIMRFLVGVNGIDPQPSQSDFIVGAETTSSIGVAIALGTVTVTLDQSMLSLLTPEITPDVLSFFQLAFQGGNLELPLQYSYVCTIVTNFVALARPPVLTSSTTATTQTVGPTTVSVLGGSGIYQYVWAFTTPSLGGNAVVSSAVGGTLTTADRLAGSAVAEMGAVGSLIGSLGGQVGVSSIASASLSASAQQALTGAATTVTAASATLVNGATLTIDSPFSPATTFTAHDLVPGQTIIALAICTVTDLVSGLTTQATCQVIITCSTAIPLIEEGSPLQLFIEGADIPLVIE